MGQAKLRKAEIEELKTQGTYKHVIVINETVDKMKDMCIRMAKEDSRLKFVVVGPGGNMTWPALVFDDGDVAYSWYRHLRDNCGFPEKAFTRLIVKSFPHQTMALH